MLESLEGYLCQCFDAIAIMLLIHITHLQRRAMNLRRMACLVRVRARRHAVGLLLPRCSSTSTMPCIQSRRGAGDMYPFLVLCVVLRVRLLPCRTRTLTE